ncbi:MAG: limonene-1,2-epoxide hydrolase family protein [Microthrixaceae bacterium]
MGANEDRNTELIEAFWADLFRRDFDAVGAWFTPGGNYRDVPAPEEGAFGPAEVAARLRLGLEPLAQYEHVPGWRIVAQGNTVMTEHVERWTWASGETVDLPFVSVHELDGDKITRWWDYWDLSTLMNAAPAAWVEHIMVGYK